MSAPDLYSTISSQAERVGASTGVSFLGADGEATISYAELLAMAAWLRHRLPLPEDQRPRVLVIAASEPLPTLVAFLAAIGMRAQPLILPPPRALQGLEAFLTRTRSVVDRLARQCAVAVVVQDGLLPPDTRIADVPHVTAPRQRARMGTAPWAPSSLPAAPGDVAFLQMTSASTGDPKLVAISHENVLANLASIRAGLGLTSADRAVSWLPMHHDMGLVGMILVSLVEGIPLALMSPEFFIRRPSRWLRALSDFGGTFTASPNFGYDHAHRLTSDAELDGVDLRSLRAAVVGAEPVRLATLTAFAERFASRGFQRESFVPAYGMAESTLASSMTRPGTVPRYVLVEPRALAVGSTVNIVGGGRLGDGAPVPERAVAVFSTGRPLEGIELSLRGDDNRPVAGDGVLGEIVVRGASVSTGYLDPESGHPVPFPGRTFHTGDLGFVQDGDLFILERKKQVIIRNGQNYLASLLEEQVARILRLSAHEIMVLDTDIHDPGSKIVAVAENVKRPESLVADQVLSLRSLEPPIDEVLFAPARVIPRTTSGKKRYHVCRQRLSARSLAIGSAVPLARTA